MGLGSQLLPAGHPPSITLVLLVPVTACFGQRLLLSPVVYTWD